jgi:hypothetical protein
METRLKQAERREAELRQALQQAVPRMLRELIEEEAVIGNLFRYGRRSTKIKFGEYGLKDFSDIDFAMKKLGKAWDKQITINLDSPDNDSVGVSFGIAQM